ncbi:MAG: hypothetical protein JSV09_10340, partial [Thermoplasmata archaeon]
VSIKKVSFTLNNDEINKNLLDKPVYKKTNYLLLNNKDQWAVVMIHKARDEDLFSEIKKIEIISLPESTKFLEDPKIDVLSPSMMAEKAEEIGCETLIIKGKFEHVSFIHNEKPEPLMVLEVVPPEPPKLVEMVKDILYSGRIKKPVKIIPEIIDLKEISKRYQNQNIVFPCHASGLSSEMKTFYLDQKPELTDEQFKSICLIGCDLSLKIFKTIYGVEPEFFNFCPKKKAIEMQPDHPAITKCCEIKEGHEKVGNIMIVPWGATQKEVENALSELLTDKKDN